LLTLSGRRCLAAADVIIYDYLANPELLRFARTEAERIFCGKHGGATRLLSQHEINGLLVERARAGLVVVRLKGGDPFIFGRGAEEAQELIAAGIPFEVVPGVTSATAVPAYAGIPLTHRDVTSTVTFVAGHSAASRSGAEVPWAHLAHGGTLVLLMSTTQLAENLSRLHREGLPAETPAALIRWGTMPAQQTIVGTLGDLADRVAALQLRPPTVVVIGEVVRMRSDVEWFEKRPLFGRSIVVTRARHQAGMFIEELEALGAGVVHVPCIDVLFPSSSTELDDALRGLERYEWIVFTSANGVRAFLDRLAVVGGDTRRLGHARLAAIGSETAKVLERAHLRADVVPNEFRAESLAATLGPDAVRGRRVLLPRAANARRVLPDTLRAFGALVDDVVAYRVETPKGDGGGVRQRLTERSVDLVTFASSTTVRHFMDLVGGDAVRKAVSLEQPHGRRRVLVGCIGPVTAETAREVGLPVDVQPEEYTISGFTRAIVARLGGGTCLGEPC